MQIQSRLTLQFIVIVAGMMLAAVLYIYIQFSNILRNEFYNTLKSKALMTAEMTVGHTDNPPLQGSRLTDKTAPKDAAYSENVSIYNMALDRIYSFNPSAPLFSTSILTHIKKEKEYRFVRGKHHALGLYYTNQTGTSFLLVSEAIFNSEYLMILAQILVWVLVIFIAMVAIGGWFFAGQALHPIRLVMNDMDAILPSDMSRRLTTTQQQDEISRLVVTFNNLLDRIEQAFTTQKLFLSNISHELKNPFSVIIAQIEITLDKARSAAEYQQTLESVLEDVRALNDVSDRLMQLAKITADNNVIDLTQLRIDELIWQSKDLLLRSHPRYKVQVEILDLPEEEEMLCVRGNEQLLKTALFNLLENGCKYSTDQSVKVYLSLLPDGRVKVTVDDNGIGIPEEELPLVFEPFYRTAGAGIAKGSGIGLSLVKSIMKLHHVDMSLANKKEQGLSVHLVFPLFSPT